MTPCALCQPGCLGASFSTTHWLHFPLGFQEKDSEPQRTIEHTWSLSYKLALSLANLSKVTLHPEGRSSHPRFPLSGLSNWPVESISHSKGSLCPLPRKGASMKCLTRVILVRDSGQRPAWCTWTFASSSEWWTHLALLVQPAPDP